MRSDHNVLERCEFPKDARGLKRSRESRANTHLLSGAGDVLTIKKDLPAQRGDLTRNQTNASRFAGTIRSNQTNDLASENFKRQVVHCSDAAKVARKTFSSQQCGFLSTVANSTQSFN